MHVQHIFTSATLAGSALGGVLASFSSTSTVTLYSSEPTQSSTVSAPETSCTVCAHPKDYDRNWNKDRVLNDTRKHHQSFKLFAYHKDGGDMRAPLHLQSQRKDMWTMKFGSTDDPDHNKDQPKWNLHDGSLQTDGSLPIKDTLYFRLFDGKFHKDTEYWTGNVYHDVSTRHPNKATYQVEGNAKLEARKGWSLVRDDSHPTSYLLKGSKPAGDFFMCLDFEHATTKASPPDLDMDDLSSGSEDFIDTFNPYLVYSSSDPKGLLELQSNKTMPVKAGCFGIDIKVRCTQGLKSRSIPFDTPQKRSLHITKRGGSTAIPFLLGFLPLPTMIRSWSLAVCFDSAAAGVLLVSGG